MTARKSGAPERTRFDSAPTTGGGSLPRTDEVGRASKPQLDVDAVTGAGEPHRRARDESAEHGRPRQIDLGVYREELEVTGRIHRHLNDDAFRNIALGGNYFPAAGIALWRAAGLFPVARAFEYPSVAGEPCGRSTPLVGVALRQRVPDPSDFADDHRVCRPRPGWPCLRVWIVAGDRPAS